MAKAAVSDLDFHLFWSEWTRDKSEGFQRGFRRASRVGVIGMHRLASPGLSSWDTNRPRDLGHIEYFFALHDRSFCNSCFSSNSPFPKNWQAGFNELGVEAG
jgi:hypothetical protein